MNEEKNYGSFFLKGAIIIAMILMVIIWYQGIFARIKDMNEFERKEIVVTDYYFEYLSKRGEILHLIDEKGNQYLVWDREEERVDSKFFEENVKLNETLTIYVLSGTGTDVYGIQDEEHVYLDVHKFVHEKPEILTYVLLIAIAGGLIYLVYALIVLRREKDGWK